MDFLSDQLVNGTRIRALTVVDVFTREAVCIRVRHRLRAKDVVEAYWPLAASCPHVSSSTTAANSQVD